MTTHATSAPLTGSEHDPRRVARLRKTQRIRITSATSLPVLTLLVGYVMWVDGLSALRVAIWAVPLLVASGIAGWAAFARRGDRMGRHRLDRVQRLPAMVSMTVLPFLVGMPADAPASPGVVLLALVVSTSLLALIGLQYRRHRQLFVSLISANGLWYAALFLLSGRLAQAILVSLWTINLCAVLIHALNTRNDLAELTDENLRMSRLDGLTGALNRVGLEAHWDATQASSATHTLLVVDLDRFREVNDRWGHKAGDDLLVEATRRLYDSIGSVGWVARIGGDEFAALLPGSIDSSQVQSAVEALVERFDQPFLMRGKAIHVHASVGMVGMAEGDELAIALANADFAMFDAKRRSESAVSVFDPAMRATLERRRELETAVTAALDGDEFDWWGQPILDTTSLAPVGVELLCRWRRNGAFENPAEFLPVLAAANLLPDLGRKNLAFAAQWLARWRDDEELSHIGLNINLTPQHLLHTAVADIEHTVPLVDRSRLGVELVETEVIPQGAGLRSQAERLGEMGCRLVLDDFGAGYSALSVLSDLKVSTIKIDRSLVSGLDNDERKSKLVAAASQIGVTLGTSTVCEGVETEEELDAIREIGIPLVQGWLFSKALPMDECENLIRKLARIAAEAPTESAIGELTEAERIQ